jgi:hypothetical protein
MLGVLYQLRPPEITNDRRNMKLDTIEVKSHNCQNDQQLPIYFKDENITVQATLIYPDAETDPQDTSASDSVMYKSVQDTMFPANANDTPIERVLGQLPPPENTIPKQSGTTT